MKIKKVLDEYLGEFVYGGIDGIVTTFAVVSAAAGAGLGSGVILVMGFANLFADGVSMGISAFLSERSEVDQYRKQRRATVVMMEEQVKKASKIIQKHLKSYGFAGKELESATKTVSTKPNKAADFIMKEEYKLAEEPQSAVSIGLVTFVSFISVGVVPLLVYLVDYIRDFSSDSLFTISAFMAALMFALVGYLKSRVAHAPVVSSILESLVLGVIAAGGAYFIGAWLSTVFGV